MKSARSRVCLFLLSFVHPIKGPPKMGVKRSNQRLRSSQSCHRKPTAVTNLVIFSPSTQVANLVPTKVTNLVIPHPEVANLTIKKGLPQQSQNSPISLYINLLTHLKSLYGIYLNGRSIHVGVTTTDLRCEKE